MQVNSVEENRQLDRDGVNHIRHQPVRSAGALDLALSEIWEGGDNHRPEPLVLRGDVVRGQTSHAKPVERDLPELAPIIEMDDANWLSVLNINLRGVFYSMRAEARAMMEQGGSIVNVASINAFLGSPGAAAYATSKHAILGLARSACQEFAPLKIRINTVCPGLIDTDMQRDIAVRVAGEAVDGFEHPLIARTPLGRMSTPSEIASAIVWLASDESSYVTGSTLIADGGVTA